MKYLLVVGFACSVYRREPRVRIFVCDKLIDEFYILPHKDTLTHAMKNFKNLKILQPFSRIEENNIKINNFPPLKFYEIELDTTLSHVKLCIEIKNSDSNNTNGFINKSTLIKLQVCYFFPLNQKLLSTFNKIKNKNRTTQKYAWYRSTENFLFDLIQNGLCWQGKNGQKFVSTIINDLPSYTIGGDGVFTCKLVKKYKIFMRKTKKSYIYNLDPRLIDYFINKYEQDANQRNTN